MYYLIVLGIRSLKRVLCDQNQDVGRAASLSGGSWEESTLFLSEFSGIFFFYLLFLLSIPVFRGCLPSLAHGPIPPSKLSLSYITLLTPSPFCFPFYKDPCNYTGPTWIIQYNIYILISSATFIILCHVI